jgi:ABC-type protease/lipase transport system fused ATPase/permease subunit
MKFLIFAFIPVELVLLYLFPIQTLAAMIGCALLFLIMVIADRALTKSYDEPKSIHDLDRRMK